ARAPLDEVEHLVGMQAQSPGAPYVGLWTRLASFDPLVLSRALEERRVVRMTVMRGTLHLVTAADAFLLRPAMEPLLRRAFRSSTFARRVAGVDLGRVVAAGEQLLHDHALTMAELGPLLAARFAHGDGEALAYTVRYLLPLVQVPPRGLWRRSGPAAFATLESWLGRRAANESTEEELEAVVLRYVGAFGPASVMDVQAWSWLTGLRVVLERLRPRLRTFVDEAGVELFDLPDAPRPPADTPAPVRFLPEYDNLLVSHADRSRVTTKGYLERAFTRGSFLVDGFVRGAWRPLRRRGSLAVVVEPFEDLETHERVAVEDEARRLATFLGTGEDAVDVTIL
ncbi:MAG TPA: winged helix DNA-binding domain-containing protein, partial [Candidatus Limnocylindrales bacterium]